MPPKSPRKQRNLPLDQYFMKEGKRTLLDGTLKERIVELYHNHSQSFTEVKRKLEKEQGIFLNRKIVAKIIRTHLAATSPSMSAYKSGRPSVITQDLKDRLKKLYLKNESISNKDVLQELSEGKPSIRISIPTLQKAKDSMMSELSTEESKAMSLKRPNREPLALATCGGIAERIKLRKTTADDQEKDTENNSIDTTSTDGDSTVASQGHWKETHTDISIECSTNAVGHSIHLGDSHSKTNSEHFNCGPHDEIDKGPTEMIEHQPDNFHGTPDASLESVGTFLDQFASSETSHVADAKGSVKDGEKGGIARLEGMLHALTKSVEDLHTKFDMVYTILTERMQSVPSTTLSNESSAALDGEPLHDDSVMEASTPQAHDAKTHVDICKTDRASEMCAEDETNLSYGVTVDRTQDNAVTSRDHHDVSVHNDVTSRDHDYVTSLDHGDVTSHDLCDVTSHDHDDVTPHDLGDVTSRDHEQSTLCDNAYENTMECPIVIYKQEGIDEEDIGSTTCPKQCAVDLAVKLIGEKTLAESTLTGFANTKKLDSNILAKMKDFVTRRFLADCTVKEQEQTWAACLQRISECCKELRSKRGAVLEESGLVSTATPDVVHEEENAVEEMTEKVENQSMGNAADIVHIGGHPNVTLSRKEYIQLSSASLPNLYTIALADKLFGTEILEKSTLTGFNNTPPLDPWIVTAIRDEVIGKFAADKSHDEKRSLWLQCQNSIASRCKNIRYKKTLTKRYSVRSPTSPLNSAIPESISSTSTDQDDVMEMDASDWSFSDDVERIAVDEDNEASSSASIKDLVVIGGNRNVTLSTRKYKEACRKTQPTLFATALADKLFGAEVLKKSTLTGKDRTSQLDVEVVDAIKSEVMDRCLSDATKEEKDQIWITCQQSIANRCKSLRFKDKSTRFPASLRCAAPPKVISRGMVPAQSAPYRQHSKSSVDARIDDKAMDSEDLEDVMIGDDPNVTMSLADYKEVSRLKGPKPYVLALAEKLLGREVLAESTVTGRGNTPKLDQDILYAIKADVIDQFAGDQSPAEQESLWSECLLCIATKCRTLRYRTDRSNETRSSHHSNQETSSDVDTITVHSDDESYSIIIGDEPGVTLTDTQYANVSAITRSNKFAIALAELLFGVDTLSTVKVTNKEHRSELDPSILKAIKVEILKRFGKGMSYEEQENLWADSFTSIALKCRTLRYARQKARGIEPHKRTGETSRTQAESTDPRSLVDVSRTVNTAASRDTIEGVAPPGFASGSPRGKNRVMIGGDPGVTLPRRTYNNLSRATQPNRYTIALAESLFGKDRLSRSTVTGHGRMEKLDDRIVSAIEAEVTGMFGKDKSIIEQERMWTSCVQSIAAKCKSLRYLRRGSVREPTPDPSASLVVEDISGLSVHPDKLEVLVGGFADVTLPLDEFREITVEVKPEGYARALAMRLFGKEMLEEPGSASRLDENTLNAIKADVLGRFATDKTPEERETMWDTCLSCIHGKSETSSHQ